MRGTAQPVIVNGQGELGTATFIAAKAGAAKPLGVAAGRRLLATVRRQQRQIERQGKEIRALLMDPGWSTGPRELEDVHRREDDDPHHDT